MDSLELEVGLREATGKGAARKLRAAGSVPAILYGAGSDSVSLEVDARKLAAVLRQGTNQIIDLKGPRGFNNRLVLLKETQVHPVSLRILHCDFYTVDTSKRIEVQVPIHVEGKAKGVELGGILELVLREVEVTCLPLSIPESLSIDVSELEVGDARHVSDLAPPEDVEILSDLAQTLVHVVAPRVEAEEAEEEAAEVEGEAPTEGEAPKAEAAEASKAEEGSGD